MKKLLLILSFGYAMAQVIDDVKYVWQPGFNFSPSISMLSNYTQSSNEIFQEIAEGAISTSPNAKTLNTKNFTYGVKASWNMVFFQQWLNTAEASFDFMHPNYGAKIAKYKVGTVDNDVKNTDSAAMSFHLRVQDVLLHANHLFGSVLPYAGIGFDLFRIGGRLGYQKGARYVSQELYLPVGSLFQFSPVLSGKIQLNVPLAGKTKYYGQKFTVVSTTTPSGNFSYDTDPANVSVSPNFSYDHDTKTSIGIEGALMFTMPMMGSGSAIEPYFQVWNFDKKDNPKDFSMRWRSFGIRANMLF